MKLLAKTRLQLTEDINIGLILNGLWQICGYDRRVNPKQAIQDIENIDISLKKVNVDSLYLLTCHEGKYQDNRCFLPQIARFISGNW